MQKFLIAVIFVIFVRCDSYVKDMDHLIYVTPDVPPYVLGNGCIFLIFIKCFKKV